MVIMSNFSSVGKDTTTKKSPWYKRSLLEGTAKVPGCGPAGFTWTPRWLLPSNHVVKRISAILRNLPDRPFDGWTEDQLESVANPYQCHKAWTWAAAKLRTLTVGTTWRRHHSLAPNGWQSSRPFARVCFLQASANAPTLCRDKPWRITCFSSSVHKDKSAHRVRTPQS